MSDKRHYNVEELHVDYSKAFSLMMKVTMIGVGGALVYFFIFITYLGGWSHTKSADYAKGFNERYPIDYNGLKLPEFGGPEKPEPKHHGDAHAAAPHAEAAVPAATHVDTAPAATTTPVEEHTEEGAH